MSDKKPILSMFRCYDPNCNALLTKEAHDLGRCGGCQQHKMKVATYLTEEEDKAIKEGKLIPHTVDLNLVEPPQPRGTENG
jgi:hypothetical protein